MTQKPRKQSKLKPGLKPSLQPEENQFLFAWENCSVEDISKWENMGYTLSELSSDPTWSGHIPLKRRKFQKVETKEKTGKIVFRSVPEALNGHPRSFFELILDKNTDLSIIRYEYDEQGDHWQSSPVALSEEFLEQLLVDLRGSLEKTDFGLP